MKICLAVHMLITISQTIIAMAMAPCLLNPLCSMGGAATNYLDTSANISFWLHITPVIPCLNIKILGSN